MTNGNEIGREYPPVVWEVQRCKIREMALAIGDDNTIYHNANAAETNGYKDIPPVPTLSRVGNHWGNMEEPIIRDLKMNLKTSVHGEETYEYLRDYYPGDVLTGVTRIADIKEKVNKSGQKMRVIDIETMWRNQNGEDVLKVNSLLIERMAQ